VHLSASYDMKHTKLVC